MPAPKKPAIAKTTTAKKQTPAKLAEASPDNANVELDGPAKLAQEAAMAATPVTVIPDEQELVAGTPPKPAVNPLPTVELEEEIVVERAPESPWTKVDELSDDEMTTEAANIQAHGRSCMLLRFRVEGRLTGLVQQVDRMHYKPGSKRSSFVTR